MNNEVDTTKKIIWFKAKKYGAGWKPVTWQGWVATIAYVLLIYIDTLDTIKFDQIVSHSNSDTVIHFLIPFFLITFLFLGLTEATCSETFKWRWGSKK